MMLIEYVANGMKREVRDSVAEALIARKLAHRVVETREMKAEDAPEISERTGKPKRRYKRRDMKAED